MDGPVCGPCAGALRPGGLRRQPGSDPDAAARRVFVTWNGVFGGLPRDGQYAAAIAMIEAENGYYIAVDVNVVKAGAQHDDSDDDEPEEEPDDGFVKVGTLNELEKALNSEDETPPKIRLTKDITISDSNWSGFPTFSGELDGNNQTVTIEGGSQGLFQEIAADGKVENLNINVAGSISASGNNDAGGVAGDKITNCHVTIESDSCISASSSDSLSYAGGVAGRNNYNGSVSDCTVTVNGSVSASSSDGISYAGGVAGDNSNNSSVGGCKVTVNGSISAGDSSFSYAGSVVGYNTNNGIVDDNNEVEDNNDLKLPEIGNQPNQS